MFPGAAGLPDFADQSEHSRKCAQLAHQGQRGNPVSAYMPIRGDVVRGGLCLELAWTGFRQSGSEKKLQNECWLGKRDEIFR